MAAKTSTKAGSRRKNRVIQLRVTEPVFDWIADYAASLDLAKTDTIMQSLRRSAKQDGFRSLPRKKG